MIKDSMGVPMKIGDRVIVTAWGGNVRLIDVRETAHVTGFTPRGNVRHDGGRQEEQIARGTAIRPGYLAVLRRDGGPGFEGNLPQYRDAYRRACLGIA